jgi:hypothetical protein
VEWAFTSSSRRTDFEFPEEGDNRPSPPFWPGS